MRASSYDPLSTLRTTAETGCVNRYSSRRAAGSKFTLRSWSRYYTAESVNKGRSDDAVTPDRIQPSASALSPIQARRLYREHRTRASRDLSLSRGSRAYTVSHALVTNKITPRASFGPAGVDCRHVGLHRQAFNLQALRRDARASGLASALELRRCRGISH